MPRAAFITLAAIILVGCSTVQPRSGAFSEIPTQVTSGERQSVVCVNCVEWSETPATRTALDSWRCPKCGYYQPSQEEMERAPKIKIITPYSVPKKPWHPVSPVTEPELKRAKAALHRVKARMKVEQVEATLGLSRFASKRLVGLGSMSLSIHYSLGNGHSLDMIYDMHFRRSSIGYRLAVVSLDEVEHWVKEHDTESN